MSFHPVEKRYHFLKVTTFVQATEKIEKVKVALENLLGDLFEEKMEETHLEGVYDNPIIYISIDLNRARAIKSVLRKWECMDFWKQAKDQLEERLDEDLTFHLRVDKMKAYEGTLALWKGGEAIEMQLKPATFPSSRDGAKAIILDGPLN